LNAYKINEPRTIVYKEEFEDIKGVIRIRISRRTDSTTAKRKKEKRTNNDLQIIHIKLKRELHEPHLKPGVNSGTSKG
jgi:hypothetical protein